LTDNFDDTSNMGKQDEIVVASIKQQHINRWLTLSCYLLALFGTFGANHSTNFMGHCVLLIGWVLPYTCTLCYFWLDLVLWVCGN